MCSNIGSGCFNWKFHLASSVSLLSSSSHSQESILPKGRCFSVCGPWRCGACLLAHTRTHLQVAKQGMVQPKLKVCNWRRWEDDGSQHPGILGDILISDLPPLLNCRQHARIVGTQCLARAVLATSSITAQLFAFRCVFPNIQLQQYSLK